jgi:hypothetical protein
MRETMMKPVLTCLAAAAASVALAAPTLAAVKTPHAWQIKTLAGVKAMQCAVGWDPSGALTQKLEAGLKPLGLPLHCIKFEKGKTVSLAGRGDALVKIETRDRNKGMVWVSLLVEQTVQLARSPSQQFQGTTYAIGELTTTDKAKQSQVVDDLIRRFVGDFQKANAAVK